MLSQLTLRFPKNLIERLKNRATTENTSVNALAERLMENSLAGSAAGEEYLQLVTDPDTAVARLYRQLILGQHSGSPSLSRDTLQFLLELAHQGYSCGRHQLVTISRLQTLLDITFELLLWQVDNNLPVDSHYLKGTFGFKGEDWHAETAAFLSGLSPAITQDHAEYLIRPLSGGCFELQEFPDEVLAGIFTTPRLQTVFPLCMYARQWSFDRRRQFMEQIRPPVPAVSETFDAGSVKFEIRIHGQETGPRTLGWYETPRLFMLLTGQEFIMPFGWSQFSELLRTFTVWHHHPEALSQGWTGDALIFSPRTTATREVIVGLDTLRIFLPEEGFAVLVRELTSRCGEGTLADALSGLRCLYGDL
ncbi:transcriptional regulator [Salmonella enterica subsp. enterica serovar Enteritidis]|nr:transcriptional regulator [Salmonella enterica subsp. enterica serovar Enteritidis]EGW9206061.1 transcriptional regulator [Salmonella enterica subsp. enterica serovar Enteritidis]